MGSAVIIWTGCEMMFGDPFVEQQLHPAHSIVLLVSAIVTILVMGAAHYFHRHRPTMRRLDRRGP